VIGRSQKLWRIGGAVFAVVMFAVNASSQGQRLLVSIPALKLEANERIIGIDFHVHSGMITQLPKVARGWSTSVDNDPSWNTRISGSLAVGAAALDADFFRDFMGIEVESDAPADHPFSLSGEIIVTSDFATERRIKLVMKDFALVKGSGSRTN
jgi:hypothetical protein